MLKKAYLVTILMASLCGFETYAVYYPDLVVLDVSSPNLDLGVVNVLVKNQGNVSSTPCYMAIRITPLGELMKVFSPPVPALSPGQTKIVSAQTGFLLSQAKYDAIVDRSNNVKESNEQNNALSGQFGGKP